MGTLRLRLDQADVAQLVEHVLGKNEVSGSIPDIGSRIVYSGKQAGVAQWQSNAFVKRGSGVRFSPPAQIKFEV